MTFFDLKMHTRVPLAVDGDPSDLITEHTGEVVHLTDDGNSETLAGYVHAQVLHAGLAANRGESLFEVADCHSQEMLDLCSFLYRPDGHEFKPALVDRFDSFDIDLLVLDYIILDPKWRQLKLGLLVARKVIDLLGGGCGLVVAELSPLRRAAHQQLRVPADWIPAPETKEGRRAAPVKLRSYFRQMGFVRLGRTPYYAMSTTQVTPSSEELLKPRTVEE